MSDVECTSLAHVGFVVLAFFWVLFSCLLHSEYFVYFFIGVRDFIAHMPEFIWIRYIFTVTRHIVFLYLHSSRLNCLSVFELMLNICMLYHMSIFIVYTCHVSFIFSFNEYVFFSSHTVIFGIVFFVVFTAQHGMQMRSSDENSVRPSVKGVNCDKTEEKSVQIFISYESSFILVICEKEWLVGATPST